MADGYGLWWHDGYWASLTTGGRSEDARHDIYFGPVPANTHGHVWIKIPDEGSPRLGSQLKDGGQQLGPPGEGQFSTQPLIRGRVERNPATGTITTNIATVSTPSTYSAAPVISDRKVSSRNPEIVRLGVPNDATWFEFELAVTGNSSSDSSSTSRVLPFGGTSPYAVRLTVNEWGH